MKQSLMLSLSLTETKANKAMTVTTKTWLQNTMLEKQVPIGVLQKYWGGERQDTIKWKQHR